MNRIKKRENEIQAHRAQFRKESQIKEMKKRRERRIRSMKESSFWIERISKELRFFILLNNLRKLRDITDDEAHDLPWSSRSDERDRRDVDVW